MPDLLGRGEVKHITAEISRRMSTYITAIAHRHSTGYPCLHHFYQHNHWIQRRFGANTGLLLALQVLLGAEVLLPYFWDL